ncbi:uncharacterized protein N7515_006661 [Penicillium bovifimosum]|uniref:Uncharacterized protein n=1 Tax=Penicillium bovifimosum TaxID=126998 RepID=A0A9W9L1G5_9EURO|nr:uncharacterized protein N7515_006661 [Penicillium bovifimosum]KAJ5130622.1 hypothetical protein N7515_006661 [Penicillium bovifimosum]
MQLTDAMKGTQQDHNMINLEGQEPEESPSSPPEDDVAENGAKVYDVLAQAVEAQRVAMRAAAAERISDANQSKPEHTPEASPPIPEAPNHLQLQDEFLESAKAIVSDPILRQKYFPDPFAVRRIRVWAGEDLATHKVKRRVNAALLPWAGVHRPFCSWQDTVSAYMWDLARARLT